MIDLAQLIAEAIGLENDITKEDEFGKATSVSLHNKGVAELSSEVMERLRNLRCLDLSFNRITSAAAFEQLSTLKELNLYENRLSSLAGITRLTGLATLELQGNALASLEGITRLRSLQLLDVSNNALGTLQHVAGLPALTCLRASAIGLTRIDGLTNVPLLAELVVSQNRLATLQGLPAGTRMKELDASGNALTSLIGIRPVAPTLETFILDDNSLASLEGLATAEFPRLLEVSVAGNRITTIAPTAFLKCPNLEDLDLSRNALSSPSALAAALAPLSALQDLTLAPIPACSEPGYRSTLCAALASLETLDGLPVTPEDRGTFAVAAVAGPADQPSGQARPADVFVVGDSDAEGSAAADAEAAAGPDAAMAEEMRRFAEQMGIRSAAAVSTMDQITGTTGTLSETLRPPTASGGRGRGAPPPPGTASGSGRPPTASTRPTTARALGAVAPATVRDPMMHQRPPSVRSGPSRGRLLSAEEFVKVRDEYSDAMASYRSELGRILTKLRSDLTGDPEKVTAELRKGGWGQANGRGPTAHLPTVPTLELAGPREADGAAAVAAPGQAAAAGPSSSSSSAAPKVADLDIPFVGTRPSTAGRRGLGAMGTWSAPPAAAAPAAGSAGGARIDRGADAYQKALAEISTGKEALAMFERLYGPNGTEWKEAAPGEGGEGVVGRDKATAALLTSLPPAPPVAGPRVRPDSIVAKLLAEDDEEEGSGGEEGAVPDWEASAADGAEEGGYDDLAGSGDESDMAAILAGATLAGDASLSLAWEDGEEDDGGKLLESGSDAGSDGGAEGGDAARPGSAMGLQTPTKKGLGPKLAPLGPAANAKPAPSKRPSSGPAGAGPLVGLTASRASSTSGSGAPRDDVARPAAPRSGASATLAVVAPAPIRNPLLNARNLSGKRLLPPAAPGSAALAAAPGLPGVGPGGTAADLPAPRARAAVGAAAVVAPLDKPSVASKAAVRPSSSSSTASGRGVSLAPVTNTAGMKPAATKGGASKAPRPAAAGAPRTKAT